MRNSYSLLRIGRLFPLRCFSYPSPHISTWWLYLNVPPAKELRRISSFSTRHLNPVCRLTLSIFWLKISTVQFWNVLTDENHRAQQCLNQTVWRSIAILSSELSVPSRNSVVYVKWRSCSMSKQNLPYPLSLRFRSNLTWSWYSSNWTKCRLRNLKIKFC